MLAIAGGKGGCGKTTTTIGVATALVARGRRPLAVEADLGMPDLHTRLGLDRDPGLDRVTAGRPVEEVARDSPRHPGISACPAGEAEPPVAASLERATYWPGPVLVDCPAGASPDAVAPLRVAEGSVVVSTDTPASLRDAAKTTAMARTLDAPPVAAVVRGSPDERAVRRLLGCETVVSLPAVSGRPLEHAGVRAGYETVADCVVNSRRDGPRTDAKTASRRRGGRTDIKSDMQRGGNFNGCK